VAISTLPETDEKFSLQYITVRRAEQYWIDRSRKNVADFITYMTDGEMAPADHHLEWLWHILGSDSSRVNIIAPRGSGKTTILVYVLAWLIGQKPWLTNGIFSVSAEQAEARLREVRSIILDNPRYHNVFPWIEIDFKKPNNLKQFTVWSRRWKDNPNEIDYPQWRSLVSRFGESMHATLFGVGIGSAGIVGRRFTGLVLVDDPHDAKNSATEEQRVKVEETLKETIIGCCKPEARLAVISTRWAETDLAGRLMEMKRRDGSKLWSTVEIPAYDDLNRSYWPQVMPSEVLENIREDVGETVFQLMYMNNPLGLSSGEFTMDMLRQHIPDRPNFSELVVSCDLARTVSTDSDFCVFAAVARDKIDPFNYYVLDMARGRYGGMDPSMDKLAEFCEFVFAKYGQLDRILFDDKGFDPVWAESFVHKNIEQPVKIVKSGTRDKADRLRAVAIKAQQGRMYVNTKMLPYNAMCSELVGFPGRHDDICDALSLPFQYWGWHGFMKVGTVYVKSPFLL
jgi:phage terminase large subunit-like protein